MKLDFLALDKLVVSKSNMRWGRKAPDVSDILPTVRSRGVLQPLLVRPNGAPDGYEIVAGARRFTAAVAVVEERRAAGEEIDPGDLTVPCAILDAGDDAAAVEASMIENMARLDADEVTQWESFTKLVRQGRTIGEVAATFGLPDLTVRRVLALGDLLPRIRAMYAKEEIDRATVRHLTMASKRQQRAWLALADDENAYLPKGQQLKAWLFGGQSIAVRHALFDVAASGLATVADLFGEDAYAVDAEAFWVLQNAALAERRQAYCDAGWADAVIVEPAEHFSVWEHEKAAKRKGGRVYLDVRASGEVVVHEGYVSRKEAARLTRGEAGSVAAKSARAEITSTMQTYCDLHRHAAVRATLTAQPGVALRLLVAHAIAGSALWTVRPEPQTTRHDEVRESLDDSKAEAAFDERRRAVLALLGFDEDAPTVVGGVSGWLADGGVVAVFARLLDVPDPAVMEVVSIVMGETLASGSAVVETLGLHLGVEMATYWSADAAFFGLLRDREVLTRIVAEVASETVAAANAGEKTKTLKRIVGDHLTGENARAKRDGWVPRWLAFPPSAYTARGGVGMIAAHAVAVAAFEEGQHATARDTGGGDPDPAAPLACAAMAKPVEDPAAAMSLAA